MRPDHGKKGLNPYAQLYADVQDAFRHSSELADPKTVEQANRHYGFTGESPLRVVRWEDRRVHVHCIVNRETGTYYFSGPKRSVLGDGDCTEADPGEGAVVVYNQEQTRWVKGIDLIRPVVDLPDPQLRNADAAHQAEPIAQVLERRIRSGGRVPQHLSPAFLRGIGVRLTHHHEVATYRVLRAGRAFQLCVVHGPSGAWALYDSRIGYRGSRPGSFVGVGDSGATCEKDLPSLTGG